MRYSDRPEIPQKKSLGQVFLTVEWPLDRMITTLRELGVERVIEIGPGPGNLTRALLSAGFKVTAIEKDRRFAEALEVSCAAVPNRAVRNLTVINTDILALDWQDWIKNGHGKAAVVGNIPYNISTPIVLKGLEVLPDLACMLFMTQLEFAERVAGSPSSKDYGSLSVFTQLRADVQLEFEVGKELFKPVPKVDSAVILIKPKAHVHPIPVLELTEKVTRQAFTQRRKKLRNSVEKFLGDKDEALSPIDLNRRADSLTPDEWVILASFLVG